MLPWRPSLPLMTADDRGPRCAQALTHGEQDDAAPREQLHSKRALFGFGKAARKRKEKDKKAAVKGEEAMGLIAGNSQDAPDGQVPTLS